MEPTTIQSSTHVIIVSTNCPYRQAACRPGVDLMKHLNAAIATGAETALLDDDFALAGNVCVKRCGRDCLVGFHATAERCYVFGDIRAGSDIDALVASADSLQEHHRNQKTPKQGTDRAFAGAVLISSGQTTIC